MATTKAANAQNVASSIVSKPLVFIKARKKLAIALLIVLAAIGFLGWQKINSSSATPKVVTKTVQKGTIVSSISASGQVIGTNRIDISSQATGVVGTVYVQNGDTVTSGQKLLEIIPDAITAQLQAQSWASYLSVNNSLNAANANMFSLQSTLFNKWNTFFNLATNSTYQNSDGSPNTTNRTLPAFTTVQDDWLAAEANYKNQQGVVSAAQASLNSAWNAYQLVSTTITAPIAGTIDNLNFAQGMVLAGSSTASTSTTTRGQTQKVATITTGNVAPIASFNIPETDVNKVKPGQRATITLDAIADQTFSGKVITVDKTGAIASGVTNYSITIQFDVENASVLSNMSVTANIILDTKTDVLEVPSSAIQTTNGQAEVRVMKNGKITQVPVETGLVSDTDTEITAGLSEGDVVVTSVATATSGASSGGTSPFSGLGARGGFGGGGGGAAVRRGN